MGNKMSANVAGFGAESLTLGKVFAEDKVYNVPVYQRPYVWSTKEAENLFEDLRQAYKGEYPHFLGSVVVACKKDGAPAEVIDGQQRLTTIFMLLQCIRHWGEEKAKWAEEHHFADTVDGRLIADQLMRLLRREKAVGVEARWRLEVRRDNPFLIAHVFEKYLPGWSADSKDTGKYVHGEAPDDQVESNQEKKIGSIFVDSESEWRLLKNANHLRKLLLKTKQSDPHFTMAHFMRHMLTEVYVVAVTCPEPELAYRVFHTLNAKDRGVDLSIIDMLKSHIFEGLKSEEIGEGEKWKETRTAQGEKWQELETKLGRDEFEKLFLYVQKIDQVEGKMGDPNALLSYFETTYVKGKSGTEINAFLERLYRYGTIAHFFLKKTFEGAGSKMKNGEKAFQDLAGASTFLTFLVDQDIWMPTCFEFCRVTSEEDLTKWATFLVKVRNLQVYLEVMRKTQADCKARWNTVAVAVKHYAASPLAAGMKRVFDAMSLTEAEIGEFKDAVVYQDFYEEELDDMDVRMYANRISKYLLLAANEHFLKPSGPLNWSTYAFDNLGVVPIVPLHPTRTVSSVVNEWRKKTVVKADGTKVPHWAPNQHNKANKKLGNLVLVDKWEITAAQHREEFAQKQQQYREHGGLRFAINKVVIEVDETFSKSPEYDRRQEWLTDQVVAAFTSKI